MREFDDGDSPPNARIAGWVARVDPEESTLTIRDQSGRLTLTVATFQDDTTGLDSVVRESVVEVSGDVVDRKGDHVRMDDASLTVYSKPQRELPIDPEDLSETGFGTRLDHRHLDLRAPETRAILKVRSEVLEALRSKLRDWGAIEFDQPLVVPSVTDPTNTQFSVTYPNHDVTLPSFHSNEYHQMLVAGGFERAFAIEKAFGYYEDGVVHPWCVAESNMLYIESAFMEYADFLEFLEDLIVHVYEHVAENCQEELAVLDRDLTVPDADFRRVPYEEFLDITNGIFDDVEYEWGDEPFYWHQKETMKEIGEYHFVTDWPVTAREANERTTSDDSETVMGFDLNHPECEVMFGGAREYRYDRLRQAYDENSPFDPDDLEWFLEAYKDGVPPYVGGTLGLDRFLMPILDLCDLREGIPFPRDRHEIV